MEVFIEKENVNKKLKYLGSAKGLLIKLNINPEEVLITRNGTLIQLDEKLIDSDKIKILSVISGG